MGEVRADTRERAGTFDFTNGLSLRRGPRNTRDHARRGTRRIFGGGLRAQAPTGQGRPISRPPTR
jgi:hypothetical protein